MTQITPVPVGWNLTDWRAAYRSGQTPQTLLFSLLAELKKIQQEDNRHIWIEIASEALLEAQITALTQRENAHNLPLFGIPFAVKDNIDALGFNTSAACPEYTYEARADAHVVHLLKQAGAIVLGKTNLDQFATGLVGTRSPYGAVPNTFKRDYISGGSSSGSAAAVALGYVPFSLGTDTAGSGRVPAGFNHLVGLKPTKGLLSTRGVVPACRSLDCVSIFALNTEDAEYVFHHAAQYDPQEPYSRPAVALPPKSIRRLAIPNMTNWFGDDLQQAAYTKATQRAADLGYELVPTDFSPFFKLAALLYEGPWVAERYAAVGNFVEQDLPGLNPVVKDIIQSGKNANAVDAFTAEYRRMSLVRTIQQVFTDVDALFVPTAPRFPTQDDVQANPVSVNSQLGTYTNFVNLADLCALALPAEWRSDQLPFGITLIAPAFHDLALLHVAARWQATLQMPIAPVLIGARTSESVVVAVVGAHLTGMPLNHQLTSRHAVFLEQTLSAKKYQLYALANTVPPKPGLVRINDAVLAEDPSQGHEIIVELWRLDLAAFGSFVQEIPQPLGIGTLELCDGRLVKGFICEPEALNSATHISQYGGWRTYMAQRNAQKSSS